MDVLRKLYPEAWPDIPMAEMKKANPEKKISFICKALTCINESWSRNYIRVDSDVKTSDMNMEHFVLATLDCMVKVGRELFVIPDEVLIQDHVSMASKDVVPTQSTKAPIAGPISPPPPSVQPSDKEAKSSPSQKKKLTPPPPPPPGVPRTLPQKTGPSPPPPLPALGAGRLQLPRKATSKLKRTTQMASLFQELKRKMDESSLAVTSSNKKRMQLGGQTGGKQGMGASIAELTKRSTYFQQIEEDVRMHRISILALQAAINSFQTNDMVKLQKFQNNVESILEVLSDESQVLAKFEGFPTKKLETLRTATALCSKFERMMNTLKNWEVKPPIGQLLDKIECYLKKIKLELDAFERNRDEESKKFRSHNIEFDFLMVTRIKEAMIDLSSSCMELAIRESRETQNAGDNRGDVQRTNKKKVESDKMLWRVFQLAFRAYSFASGQDDRANVLAKQLADRLLGKPTNQ